MRFQTNVFLVVAITFILAGCTNFHIVDADKLYRSGQMSGDELREVIEAYDVRTVVNLRGESPGKTWYNDEISVCRELGVDHHDIDMSARRIPHKEDLRKLLDVFRDADRPMLVHCQGGSDRTGLASAIYAIEYMGKSKHEAKAMLSIRYLHFSMFTPNKRYFLRLYQGRDWAYHVYDPTMQEYEYYP